MFGQRLVREPHLEWSASPCAAPCLPPTYYIGKRKDSAASGNGDRTGGLKLYDLRLDHAVYSEDLLKYAIADGGVHGDEGNLFAGCET